jgi:hypothetical protein
MRSVSQLRCKRLVATMEWAMFSCSYNRRKCLVMYETKNFLSIFFRIPLLSLFYPSSQQCRITEERSKNVKRTNRTIKQSFYGFQMFYDTTASGSMSRVTSRNDFIMQNYFVKKRGNYFVQ